MGFWGFGVLGLWGGICEGDHCRGQGEVESYGGQAGWDLGCGGTHYDGPFSAT